jgi:hypothetical protein
MDKKHTDAVIHIVERIAGLQVVGVHNPAPKADDGLVERDTGWYWVLGLGDGPEVARWDYAGQAWSVVGGYEGVPAEGITVIGGPLQPPAGTSGDT